MHQLWIERKVLYEYFWVFDFASTHQLGKKGTEFILCRTHGTKNLLHMATVLPLYRLRTCVSTQHAYAYQRLSRDFGAHRQSEIDTKEKDR